MVHGQGHSYQKFASKTVVKDDAIPKLLHTVKKATFVTINVKDFWKKFQAHDNYCIVAIDFPQSEAHQIPAVLRRVLQLSAFSNKVNRMGTVIYISPNKLRFYGRDKLVYNAHLDS